MLYLKNVNLFTYNKLHNHSKVSMNIYTVYIVLQISDAD